MVRNADAKAGVGQDRSRLPWVFGKTYPLGPAVARLADGVEGRRAHVYGQGWVRLVQGVRGALPPLMALGSRSVAEVEAGLKSAGRPSARGGRANAGGDQAHVRAAQGPPKTSR